MSLRRAENVPTIDDEVREQARHVIARWRERGFNTVLCYRAGYCAPANSAACPVPLPAGYFSYSVDSSDALEALAQSIAKGDTYRT